MFFDIILDDYLFDIALNSPNEGELFLAFLAFLRSVANSTFEELLHIAFTSFVKFSHRRPCFEFQNDDKSGCKNINCFELPLAVFTLFGSKVKKRHGS